MFLFVFILLIISYSEKDYKHVINNQKEEKIKNEENKKVDKKTVKENNKVQKVSIVYKDKKEETLDLEDYVVGVVACEMPASFDDEALKAMAVAARTFALYKIKTNKNYKLSTTTKDQCYITKDRMKKNWGKNYEKNYNKILKSVKDTSNQYMTYNDKVIISFYFSISNGYTENCENVFSQKLAYLKGVDSSWDKEYSYKEKTIKISEKEFLSKLNIKDSSVKSIKIKKDKSNRAEFVYINGIKFKGTKFRSSLSLRSTDVSIDNKEGYIYITTKGYGHGVGMSQYGAQGMAKKGYTYDEILKHYYQGIELSV